MYLLKGLFMFLKTSVFCLLFTLGGSSFICGVCSFLYFLLLKMNSEHLTVPAKPDCEHWHHDSDLITSYWMSTTCQAVNEAFLHNWLNTPCVHGPNSLGDYLTNSHVTMSFIFCILMFLHLGVLMTLEGLLFTG